jgi:cation:H+ antiporter
VHHVGPAPAFPNRQSGLSAAGTGESALDSMFEGLSTTSNLALFVGAAIAVWLAGVRLTHCVDAIASRTGMGQEMAGLLLLGGATSLPELAVATSATLRGAPALTVNDLLGSAAVNVVLLALADATIRRRALTSVQGSPKVLLIGVLGVLVMAVVIAPAITGDALLLGVGRWNWLMLLVFLCAVWIMAHSRAAEAWQLQGKSPLQRESDNAGGDAAAGGMHRLVLRTLVAAGVVLTAGIVLAGSGEAIAQQTGLGTSFFGAVFLAFATSLPEASTVLTAVRLKRYELAISDVLGTNIFNATIIFLVDALHPGGPVLIETGRFASFSALLALVLTCLFLVGLVERRDRAIAGLGLDSILVLLTYAGGLVVLYSLR